MYSSVFLLSVLWEMSITNYRTMFLLFFWQIPGWVGESVIGGGADSPSGGGKKMSWKKAVLSAVQVYEDTAVTLRLHHLSGPHSPIHSSSHTLDGANGRPEGRMETDVAIIAINSVMATVFMRDKGFRKWVPAKKDVWICGGYRVKVKRERSCILQIGVAVMWAWLKKNVIYKDAEFVCLFVCFA